MTKKVDPAEVAAPDYLMWVGSMFYPTVDEFIEEAKSMGVCKRLGRLPLDLVLGATRIFLAHDDGIEGEGFVFGYFVPNVLDNIVEEEEDVIDDPRISMIYYSDVSGENERGCGFRRPGLYARFDPGKEGTGFVEFTSPRTLEKFDPGRGHFRGLLRIDYGNKLVLATKSKCMVPPSRRAAKFNEDPWTTKEDEDIVANLTGSENAAKDAQILAYRWGRTKAQILYRFRTLTKEEE